MILAILIYLVIGMIICKWSKEPSLLLMFLWLPALIASAIIYIIYQL